MQEFECRWCGKRIWVGRNDAPPEECPKCAYKGLTPVHHGRQAFGFRGGSASSPRLWPIAVFTVLGILVGVPLVEVLLRSSFGEHKAIEEIVWRGRVGAVIAVVVLGLAVSAWVRQHRS